MTKLECEMALVRVAQAAREICKAYDPDINHLSLTCIDGNVDVVAYKQDADEKQLDCYMFADGMYRFGGQYVKAGEVPA